MKEYKYRITSLESNVIRDVVGYHNVFWYLGRYIYNKDCVSQLLSEKELSICDKAEGWCENAIPGDKLTTDDFSIEVLNS